MLPAKPLISCTKTCHTPLFCNARLIFSKRDENRDEAWSLLWLESHAVFIHQSFQLAQVLSASPLPAHGDLQSWHTGPCSSSRNPSVVDGTLPAVSQCTSRSQAAFRVQKAGPGTSDEPVIKEEKVKHFQMLIRSRLKHFSTSMKLC